MKFIESDRIELKEMINSAFKKEVIAFANTEGGSIYIGVRDDGDVIGIANPNEEMERISSIIHDSIRPDLVPFTTVETEEFDGRQVIHVTVSKGGRPPYHLYDKGLKPSGVYVRHGVASVPASEDQIREMIRQSDGVTFDKARSINQELTFNFAEEFFKKRSVAFENENKRTLGLVDSDGYYTNAALLISDQCEHSIKCAVFEGNGKTHFKARKEFCGSILKQLEDAYEYIDLHNNTNDKFIGLERVESFDYPKYALREALLNSIVHRDYNYSGSIIVNIFSNRMEFVSIGGLVKGLTLSDIMNGVSQSRNMIIANVFYRLKLIESYGTGIQRIVESYSGSVSPEFLIEPASFVTVLPNVNVKLQINESVGEYSGLTPKEADIVKMIEVKHEISRKDVEDLFNCSSFPARKLLNSLLEKNIIAAVGKARATKYIMK